MNVTYGICREVCGCGRGLPECHFPMAVVGTLAGSCCGSVDATVRANRGAGRRLPEWASELVPAIMAAVSTEPPTELEKQTSGGKNKASKRIPACNSYCETDSEIVRSHKKPLSVEKSRQASPKR